MRDNDLVEAELGFACDTGVSLPNTRLHGRGNVASKHITPQMDDTLHKLSVLHKPLEGNFGHY